MIIVKKANEGNKVIIYSLIIIAMLSASGYLFYKQFSGSDTAATPPVAVSQTGTNTTMPIPGLSGTATGSVPVKINLNNLDIKKVVDISIFSDPKFNSLKDSTIKREPSPIGTKNPFGQ
jgi:hypothetical protein